MAEKPMAWRSKAVSDEALADVWVRTTVEGSCSFLKPNPQGESEL